MSERKTQYNYEFAKAEVEEGVAIVYLNRPDKRNAISPELSRDMNRLLDDVKKDKEVKVIIVTGAGDKAFCAGMDLGEFYKMRESKGKHVSDYGEGTSEMDWWEKLRLMPKATIAAVNGYNFGGGMIVSGVCDIAVTAEDARWGLSEINFGVIPAGGATDIVLKAIPEKWARWMILTGETIDGREAARMGLANKAVPRDKVMDEALAMAKKMAVHNETTVAWAKKVINEDLQILDHKRAADFEIMASRALSKEMPDLFATGTKAFLQKEYKPGLETIDLTEKGKTKRAETE